MKKPSTRAQGRHNKEKGWCPICKTPVRSPARHNRRHHPNLKRNGARLIK